MSNAQQEMGCGVQDPILPLDMVRHIMDVCDPLEQYVMSYLCKDSHRHFHQLVCEKSWTYDMKSFFAFVDFKKIAHGPPPTPSFVKMVLRGELPIPPAVQPRSYMMKREDYAPHPLFYRMRYYPLAKAAIRGDSVETIEAFIDTAKEVGASFRDKFLRQLHYKAVLYGSPRLLEYAYKKGQDIGLDSAFFLDFALRSGHWPIVEWTLAHKKNPSMDVTAISSAVSSGNYDLFLKTIELISPTSASYDELVCEVGSSGSSLLSSASRHKDTRIFDWLLQRKERVDHEDLRGFWENLVEAPNDATAHILTALESELERFDRTRHGFISRHVMRKAARMGRIKLLEWAVARERSKKLMFTNPEDQKEFFLVAVEAGQLETAKFIWHHILGDGAIHILEKRRSPFLFTKTRKGLTGPYPARSPSDFLL